MAKLKVQTFNIRTSRAHDGINVFDNRKQKISAAIRDADADIIGFQEVTDLTRRWLPEQLADTYTFLGCGRDKNYLGEGCTLAFKHQKFSFVSCNVLWLSPTPHLAGSTYADSDQSEFPRHYVRACLCHNDTGHLLWVYNTHLDHRGVGARVLEINQMIEDIKSAGGDFLLLGDFNVTPESEVRELLGEQLPSAHDITEHIECTFHGYGKDYRKIDYIYTNMQSSGADVYPDAGENGIYISDHYAIVATVEN